MLSGYLFDNGNRFNCYFTIEEAITRPGQLYTSYEQRNITDKPVASLNKLVEKLKSELPDALVVPDPSNPKIIHIINKEIKNTSNYPLDQLVTLAYQGSLSGLATEVGTQTKGVVEPGGIRSTIDMLIGMDDTTQVHVNVQNSPVREALTSAIPLTGYSRILWRALPSDTPKDGTYAMYIQFYGPSHYPPKLKSSQVVGSKP